MDRYEFKSPTAQQEALIPKGDDAQKAHRKMIAELARLHKELEPFEHDDSVRKLAHPLRALSMLSSIERPAIEAMLTPRLAEFARSRMRQRIDTITIFDELFSRGWDGPPRGYHRESMGQFMGTVRHQVCGGSMFTITDELMSMLNQTDLDLESLPSDLLRLPYPCVYIELGQNRPACPPELDLIHPTSGRHPLEGGYIAELVDDKNRRCLEFTLCGQPADQSHIGDDMCWWIKLEIVDGVPLSRCIAEAFEARRFVGNPSHEQLILEEQRRANRHLEIPAFQARLEAVIKALLYIVSQSERGKLKQSVCEDRTQAKKRLMRAQSGAHKRKALRDMLRSADTVYIHAPISYTESSLSSGQTGRTMRPHWRRGHVRGQRFGPGLSQVRAVFIEPVLVNADSGVVANPKNYMVGT